jgi:hypothetical protein
VYKIVKVILGRKLKCPKRIPRVLTEVHKKKRKNATRENIYLHNLDPEFFEDHIVTGDETWIHYYTSENKRQSMQWLPAGMSRPQKVMKKWSAAKVW